MYTYKIRLSYNDDAEDIRIKENELQHAYYAFMTEGRVVLPSGQAIRGKDIISILEDPIANMGWNANYQPTPEEWGEIDRKIGNKAKLIAEKHKTAAEMIIVYKLPHLLGTPEAMQLLPDNLRLN